MLSSDLFSILSETGPGSKIPGIFVEKVRPGSVAEQVGLEAGDQIMEVNETSFRRITWQEVSYMNCSVYFTS